MTPGHRDRAQDKQKIRCGTEDLEEGKFCGQGCPSIQGNEIQRNEEISKEAQGD